MGVGPSREELKAGAQAFETLNIPYEQLPQPPFMVGWREREHDMHKTGIYHTVQDYASRYGNNPPLTQPEKEAIAYHYARARATTRYSAPASLIIAGAFQYRTYASYGFPFFTPKKINPNQFGPIAQGQLAQKCWHLLRFTAWYAAAKFVCVLVIGSYSTSIFTANVLTDPRLRERNKAVRERRKPGLSSESVQQQFTPEQQEFIREKWNASEQQTENVKTTPEQLPQASAYPVSYNPWPSKQPVQAAQPTSPPQSPFDDDTEDIFDDASPVAASEQLKDKMASATAPRQPPQTGSWERLRAQARSETPATTQAKPSAWGQRLQDEMSAQASRDGKSYTYTSGEEEKSYAKDQAQRKFDEMLEQERYGRYQEGGSRRF